LQFNAHFSVLYPLFPVTLSTLTPLWSFFISTAIKYIIPKEAPRVTVCAYAAVLSVLISPDILLEKKDSSLPFFMVSGSRRLRSTKTNDLCVGLAQQGQAALFPPPRLPQSLNASHVGP
jgi:hypothetical protein